MTGTHAFKQWSERQKAKGDCSIIHFFGHWIKYKKDHLFSKEVWHAEAQFSTEYMVNMVENKTGAQNQGIMEKWLTTSTSFKFGGPVQASQSVPKA